MRYSASKITTYKGCPLAYYLKYVRHEIVPEDVRRSFGKVVHSMLDKFYELNYKSADSFAGAFKFNWFRYCSGESLSEKLKNRFKVIEYPGEEGKSLRLSTYITFGRKDFDESEEELMKKNKGIFFGYMKIGSDIMKRFYEEYIDRPDPVVREQPFDLYIDGLPGINGVRKKHFVRVIFDRVDEVDGHIAISDYKTDAGIPENKAFTLHRHPQFTLYSMALRQLVAEKRVSFACGARKEDAILYHHLRSGKKLITHRSEEDFDYFRGLLDNVDERIKKQDFTPFYGFHCNMCEYQVPCEEWSVSHGGPKIIAPYGNIKYAKQADWDNFWVEKDFKEFMQRKIIADFEKGGQLELKFPSIPEPEPPRIEVYTQKRIKWKKPKKPKVTGDETQLKLNMN